MDKKIALKVEGLKQHFKVSRKETVKAVDDISFEIYEGETFGLVGESGSGKSTTGRSIIRLYKPTDGKITFYDYDLSGKLDNETSAFLGQKMQMIFQDPMASLNPRMKVFDIVSEGLIINKMCKTKEEIEEKVFDILTKVGLSKEHAYRYPHEFSGGQRQRVGIARALITSPNFIIADEAISALDVSVQAQVVNLMKDLQKEFGLTYLFIAHDLSMVKYISDRIAVMNRGKIVEIGDADEIYYNPVHPYTKSLLTAIPQPSPLSEKKRKRIDYDRSIHDYENETPSYHNLSDSHIIYCSDRELEEWTK